MVGLGQEWWEHRVEIYVPSTTSLDEPLSQAETEQLVQEVARFLSELFGGATAVPARGFWLANDNRLIIEHVTIVYSHSRDLSNQQIEKIFAFVDDLKLSLEQEAMLIVIDGRALLR